MDYHTTTMDAAADQAGISTSTANVSITITDGSDGKETNFTTATPPHPQAEDLQEQSHLRKRKAKTVKERVKAYRKRVKLDAEKYAEVKRKDAERKRLARAGNKNQSESKKKREKELNVARVRRFREKRRPKIVKEHDEQVPERENMHGSFKSPQSFGKAVRRVTSALPASPRKRKAVVSKLVISERLFRVKPRSQNCDASSFAAAAKDNGSKVSVLEITQENITSFLEDNKMDELWMSVPTLKGTQGVHWLKPVNKASIHFKPYSEADESKLGVHAFSDTGGQEEDEEEEQPHPALMTAPIGSFVRVEFLTKKSAKYFVAQIRSIHTDGCTVKFLKRQRSTNFFVYSEEEESFVEQAQITALLPTPTMDNRNHIYFQTDVEAE